MPRLTITPEDYLRGRILNPAWYRLKVKSAVDELSKAGDSNNVVVDFVVVSGPKQKDGSDPAGIPLRRYYSEKAPGFANKLFQAFGAGLDGKKTAIVDFDGIVGKEIDGFIDNQLDNKNV